MNRKDIHATKPLFLDDAENISINIYVSDSACVMSVFERITPKRVAFESTLFKNESDDEKLEIANKYVKIYNNSEFLFKEYRDITNIFNAFRMTL